jgi:hypothetical protein
MVPDQVAPPPEFRPYRRFVSWFVLGFVSIGCLYLLMSVGVTIYRRRNAVLVGAPVGRVASAADIGSCAEELTDVEQALERHLENFHDLVSHYDADKAQRWYEDRSFWLGQWRAAGERCHFAETRPGPFSKEWEQLRVVHDDLRETEASYHKELLHFGETQAPRLGRIRDRLEKVSKRLTGSGLSDDRTQPSAARDSGEIP